MIHATNCIELTKRASLAVLDYYRLNRPLCCCPLASKFHKQIRAGLPRRGLENVPIRRNMGSPLAKVGCLSNIRTLSYPRC